MTESEFNQVRATLGRVFPSLLSWFLSLDGVDDDGKPKVASVVRDAMRQRWRACLESVTLGDALAAIDGLAREACDPWPYPGDKERAAAIIAKRAQEIADERAQREQAVRRAAEAAVLSRSAAKRVASAPLAFGRISERLRAKLGECRDAHPDANEEQVVRLAAAQLTEELDRTDPLEPDGARYECGICRDDGRVSVLLPEYVAGVAAEVIDPWLDVQTADCRCVCRRGQARADGPRAIGWAAFNGDRHVVAWRGKRQMIADAKAVMAARSAGEKQQRFAAFDEFNSAPARAA